MASDCINPEYLPASFKGVPFEAVTSEDEFGRRGNEYEYPLADKTSFKDLGRKIRRYNVEGRIVSGNHAAITAAIVAVAESEGPGLLMHPVYGPVQVSCLSLKTGFEYKDKKRYTKLTFEFVEASDSLAPFSFGGAISGLLSVVMLAVTASARNVTWANSPSVSQASLAVSSALAQLVRPAVDEDSFDVVDRLLRGTKSLLAYTTFSGTLEPIVEGTAQVRILHEDAQTRLRAFNTKVVEEVIKYPAIESLGVSSRLALVGDFALITAQKTYPTIRDAVTDLDFVMKIYDEEELIASQKSDDILVNAISSARAVSSSVILSRNIQLPGVTTFDARGQWPSLVAAHNIYGDGTRFEELENYNPTFPTFAISRDAVGLSR